MEQNWKELLHGGFAFMTAPFGVHPNDEKRAEEFLEVAKAQGIKLNEVLTEADEYLRNQGCNQDYIEKELDRVRKFYIDGF